MKFEAFFIISANFLFLRSEEIEKGLTALTRLGFQSSLYELLK